MSSMNERIDELFDKVRELIKNKKYDDAKEILNSILILDENNEEASYALKKIAEVTVIDKPNLFWESKMAKIQQHWVYVTDLNGQNVDLKQITPTSFILPIGKYKVTFQASGYSTKYGNFEIKTNKTKVLIKTFYKRFYLGTELEIITWEED